MRRGNFSFNVVKFGGGGVPLKIIKISKTGKKHYLQAEP